MADQSPMGRTEFPAHSRISGILNSQEMLNADSTGTRRPIRVAIDAQGLDLRSGGVAHVLVAVLRAIAQLGDGAESYRILVSSERDAEMWRSELGPNQD